MSWVWFFGGFYSSCKFTTRVFILWGAKAENPSPFSRGEFSARQIPLTLPVFFLEGKFCKPNNHPRTLCEVDFSSNFLLWQLTPSLGVPGIHYSFEQTSYLFLSYFIFHLLLADITSNYLLKCANYDQVFVFYCYYFQNIVINLMVSLWPGQSMDLTSRTRTLV